MKQGIRIDQAHRWKWGPVGSARAHVAIVAGFVSMALLPAGCANRVDQPNAAVVPVELQNRVLGDFQGRYGSVESVFASAKTTMAAWRSAEPGNTSGLAPQPNESEMAIYALFVRGAFTVTQPRQTVTYEAGRVVFDAVGSILSAQLWPESEARAPFSNADPPFWPAFDG